MTCLSPEKWQEYALHRSIDTTDRELMTATINGWVGTYLKECVSTIRSLQSMATQSEHEKLKVSTLLKRWTQIRDLCETILNGTTGQSAGTVCD